MSSISRGFQLAILHRHFYNVVVVLILIFIIKGIVHTLGSLFTFQCSLLSCKCQGSSAQSALIVRPVQ